MARGNRSKPPLQRTDEERERERKERERRRAGEATEPREDPPAVEVPPPAPILAEEPAEAPPILVPLEDPPAPITSQSQPPQPARRDALLEQRRHRLRAGRGEGEGKLLNLTRARAGALLALVVAIVFVWFLASLFQPFAGSGHGRVIVEIPRGSSSSAIGSILARDGVVSSGFFFELRAFLEGKRGELHSGRFQLERDMSYSAAIDALSKPPPKAIAVKVVIPEGYTRHADRGTRRRRRAERRLPLRPSARLCSTRPHYGAPASTPDLEGFLFPATYDLAAGASVKPTRGRAADGLPRALRRAPIAAARTSCTSRPTSC